jgi:streptomycin 6-kinase
LRQVDVIADAARLDRYRLLAWIASWAALSACWHLEDGENPDTALVIARMAMSKLKNGDLLL